MTAAASRLVSRSVKFPHYATRMPRGGALAAAIRHVERFARDGDQVKKVETKSDGAIYRRSVADSPSQRLETMLRILEGCRRLAQRPVETSEIYNLDSKG